MDEFSLGLRLILAYTALFVASVFTLEEFPQDLFFLIFS